MRIVSWNLWWRYGPWERRREAIATTLAEVRPDLCGLQEVWGATGANLAAELARRLEMHWCWAAASHTCDEGGEALSIGNAFSAAGRSPCMRRPTCPPAAWRTSAGWQCTRASTLRAVRCLCSPLT